MRIIASDTCNLISGGVICNKKAISLTRDGYVCHSVHHLVQTEISQQLSDGLILRMNPNDLIVIPSVLLLHHSISR